jgi:hypothetical protein
MCAEQKVVDDWVKNIRKELGESESLVVTPGVE